MKMQWKWTPVPCWAVIRLGSMMIYYFTFSILWHCSRMMARTAGWECIRESGHLQVRGDMITLPWMNPQRQQSKLSVVIHFVHSTHGHSFSGLSEKNEQKVFKIWWTQFDTKLTPPKKKIPVSWSAETKPSITTAPLQIFGANKTTFLHKGARIDSENVSPKKIPSSAATPWCTFTYRKAAFIPTTQKHKTPTLCESPETSFIQKLLL